MHQRSIFEQGFPQLVAGNVFIIRRTQQEWGRRNALFTQRGLMENSPMKVLKT